MRSILPFAASRCCRGGLATTADVAPCVDACANPAEGNGAGRGGRTRLRVGHRAELVRPAPAADTGAARGLTAAAHPAHFRRPPDTRSSSADVVAAVAGCTRARPGG